MPKEQTDRPPACWQAPTLQAAFNAACALRDLLRVAHSTAIHAEDTRANRLLAHCLYQTAADAEGLRQSIAELNEANSP